MHGEKGQSLIELVVSIAIAILVLSSLAFAIITSLRNAGFASSQAQATKLAQEGLERVRSIRDRSNFNDLWTQQLSCSDASCYFKFESGVLIHVTSGSFEAIPPFKRQILIEDEGVDQKKVTAVVEWNDASGRHESRLTTILGKEL